MRDPARGPGKHSEDGRIRKGVALELRCKAGSRWRLCRAVDCTVEGRKLISGTRRREENHIRLSGEKVIGGDDWKLETAGRQQRGVTRYHVPHTENVEALRQT
jgi:hypothetical protein